MASPQFQRTAHHLGVVARERIKEARQLITADLASLQVLTARNLSSARSKVGDLDLQRERAVGFAAALVLAVSASGLAVNATLGSDSDAVPAAAPSDSASQVGSAVVISNVSDGRDGRAFVLAGGVPLFPLPAGNMSSVVDMPIEAQDVAVLSVVPNVGFWVGNNPSERVFVSPRPPSGPDTPAVPLPELVPGQMVNFSGYMRSVSEQATKLGLVEPGEIATLNTQGHRIEANSIRPQGVAPSAK